MSKKDYVLVAGVIKQAVDGQKAGSHCAVKYADVMLSNITAGLIEAFKRDNPRFDDYQFIKAISITE